MMNDSKKNMTKRKMQEGFNPKPDYITRSSYPGPYEVNDMYLLGPDNADSPSGNAYNDTRMVRVNVSDQTDGSNSGSTQGNRSSDVNLEDPNGTYYPKDAEFDLAVLNRTYVNKDANDMIDILHLDRSSMNELNNNEKIAEAKIIEGYQDEMVYNETHPFNTIPLGSQIYSYTYLPPENWFRAFNPPPICITDHYNKVSPVYSGTTTSDLMEFDTARRFMPPYGTNLNYVNNVLNQNETQYKKRMMARGNTQGVGSTGTKNSAN
jgi:hypothetical protein